MFLLNMTEDQPFPRNCLIQVISGYVLRCCCKTYSYSSDDDDKGIKGYDIYIVFIVNAYPGKQTGAERLDKELIVGHEAVEASRAADSDWGYGKQ